MRPVIRWAMLATVAALAIGLVGVAVELGLPPDEGARTPAAREDVVAAVEAPTDPAAAPAELPADPWEAYKARFLAPEGRIVDTGNAGVSHSEGQAWGMLLAVDADDRATFDRLWAWTRDTLQWRGAHLFAWRWDPSAEEPVGDANNATDGDLMIAWALARADERWGVPEYRVEAAAIARDIRRLVFSVADGDRHLLPGFAGFDGADQPVIVNLSYYVWPAIDVMARLDPSPAWDEVKDRGLALLADARFGRWNLPPDWLSLQPDAEPGPAAGRPPRFGYEAIRVPLYLAWSGRDDDRWLGPFRELWRDTRGMPAPPAWVDLTDDELGPPAAGAGYPAIAALVTRAETGGLPLPGAADDYYAASLALLARMAAEAAERRG